MKFFEIIFVIKKSISLILYNLLNLIERYHFHRQVSKQQGFFLGLLLSLALSNP